MYELHSVYAWERERVRGVCFLWQVAGVWKDGWETPSPLLMGPYPSASRWAGFLSVLSVLF
jgi:hypothetical protein